MKRFGAVVLLVTLAFGAGACADNAEDQTPEPNASVTASPTPEPSIAATSVDVEVKDGAVVGGAQRTKVPLNNEVRLSVRSDVADEVHVHGYDETRDVPKDGGILMTFVADVPGIFLIELEDAGLKIAELEVS